MFYRAQLILDTKLRDDLEFISVVEGKSVSLLVREYLKDKVTKQKEKYKMKKSINTARVMLEMAKSAKKLGLSGPKDLSINHDHYLYGSTKKMV